MVKNHSHSAKVFKALCSEPRLEVLSLLQDGEKCACELLIRMSIGQSTLSHHMKILVESGIVDVRKEGKWMYYSISLKGSEKAIALLTQLTAVKADNVGRERCQWIASATL
ncbi:MAG: metalloregulator ArsR/SmtB family transcription factor [Coriobacteriia bacterium]|nr:metalloregulator ArsR/SmtB family transcription factor [Coriobacteriia bacterium]